MEGVDEARKKNKDQHNHPGAPLVVAADSKLAPG